jgi:hypothetical protein
MGSVEWITPSTLAIPVMRNNARIKHVAPSLVVHLAIPVMRNSARIKHVAPSLVVQESKSDIKFMCWELAK